MAVTLTNAVFLNLDPLEVFGGGLRIEAETIAEVGAGVSPKPGDRVVDCAGALVMPGLVNGHTHLYSALAPGMSMPAEPPRNFHEILRRIWWRLDRALDAESIETSGRIGALDALRCGTTALIDHHASPACIASSLDALERGIAEVGIRSVLCYETTDRNGPGGAEAGLDENRRYLDKCRHRSDGRFAALVGAHAAFTMSDESLDACVQLAADYETGVHIHAAEDPCDDALCRKEYGAPLWARLQACGLFPAEDDAAHPNPVARASILAHGTHLSPDQARRAAVQLAAIAHNPRSNMNNRVGYAPVDCMDRVLLGTDGLGADMFAEARHAWFKACDDKYSSQRIDRETGKPVTPDRILRWLAHSARVAGDILGCTIGKLAPGAAADIVITDYVPATPLTADNASAHFIFALGSQFVRDVLVAGQWVLEDRRPSNLDEPSTRLASVPVAQSLWSRMQNLDDEP